METAFEREKRHAEERTKRQANIDEITARLDEARSIYPLCQDHIERISVNREIDRLEKMLYEEQTAMATIGGDDLNTEFFVQNMTM